VIPGNADFVRHRSKLVLRPPGSGNLAVPPRINLLQRMYDKKRRIRTTKTTIIKRLPQKFKTME
jgi:hypothetical protein